MKLLILVTFLSALSLSGLANDLEAESILDIGTDETVLIDDSDSPSDDIASTSDDSEEI